MSREKEYKHYKSYAISKNYTDETFNRIYDIFCTYRSRGGVLHFAEFANIPIKRNVGKSLETETTMWTKYIREQLATNGI